MKTTVASPNITPRLIDLHQLAAHLGVSYWTARDYVLAGYIPVVDLPPLRPREGERPRQSLRRVLVDMQDADAFIARCKSGGAVDVQSPAGADSLSEESTAVPAVVPVRRKVGGRR